MSFERYYQLDSIDIGILKIIYKNTTINVNDLAKLINTDNVYSTPTLRVRLLKLIKLGFIERLDNHILYSNTRYKIYRINRYGNIDWDIIYDFDQFIENNILNIIDINLLEILKIIINKKIYSCKSIANISNIKNSTVRTRLNKLHRLKILDKRKGIDSNQFCYCYYISKNFAEKTIIEVLETRQENIKF